jgi:hypothetical protein
MPVSPYVARVPRLRFLIKKHSNGRNDRRSGSNLNNRSPRRVISRSAGTDRSTATLRQCVGLDAAQFRTLGENAMRMRLIATIGAIWLAGTGVSLSAPISAAAIGEAAEQLNVTESVHCRPFRHWHRWGYGRGCAYGPRVYFDDGVRVRSRFSVHHRHGFHSRFGVRDGFRGDGFRGGVRSGVTVRSGEPGFRGGANIQSGTRGGASVGGGATVRSGGGGVPGTAGGMNTAPTGGGGGGRGGAAGGGAGGGGGGGGGTPGTAGGMNR